MPVADTTDTGQPLGWLRAMLWAPDADVRITSAPDPKRRAWAVIPSASAPRVLVPPGRFAVASMRQFNDSMSALARSRKTLVGAALAVAGRRAPGVSWLVASPGDDDDLFDGFLPSVLGVAAVEVSMSIGRRLRPNLKPVLQVMSSSGDVIAFAKIGWNDLTRGLVENEARALAAWGESPPASFRVPRLLFAGTWRGLSITVVSAVPQGRTLQRVRDALPGAAVAREIANASAVERAALADHPYGRRLRERVTAVERGRHGGVLAEAVDRALASARDVRTGTVHGDWTPWNMLRADGTLSIWDWERSTDDVPLGMDQVHFGFEVGYHKRAMDVDAALDAGRMTLRRHAAALEIGDEEIPTLTTIFAIDRLLRLEEGRSAGVAVDERLALGLAGVLHRGDPR